MKKTFYFLLILILPVFSFAQSFERSLIGSAGTQSTKGDVSLDWSIGETMVADFSNSKAILSQGLNQWIKVLTAVRELPDWHDDVSIFPNPFVDVVTLKSSNLKDYSIELYNVSGNLILKQQWSGEENTLNLGNLHEGIYLFVIKDIKGKFITLKAIKQNIN
jgi:hypothetical protein